MDPKHLRTMERLNCWLAGILVLGSALLFDRSVTLGVAVGALLSCANFYGIHRIWEAALSAQGRKRVILQLLLMVKMVGLMLFVFVAMKFLPLDPAALAVGLSIFLLSIAVESLRFALGHGTHEGQDGRA
jgi:hypothetical protein